MIRLARDVDAEARAVRKVVEDQVERRADRPVRPDRPGALRGPGDVDRIPMRRSPCAWPYGTVKGYEEDGKRVPPYTTIGGAFTHADAHGNADPYVLPPSWFEARAAGRLKLDTPLDLATTAGHHRRQLGQPHHRPIRRGRSA